MIWLLVGCDGPAEVDPPVAEPTFQPAQGTWEVTFDAEYGGDCVLADPSTGRGVEDWYVDPSVNGHLTFRPQLYQVSACLLTDRDFDCVVGWLGAAVSANAVETSDYSIEGTFSDATTMSGTFVADAACEGGGCRALADTYGPDFRYPCTGTAGFTGVLGD